MKASLAELAELTETELVGDPDFMVQGVADLESASLHHISYVTLHPYGRAIRSYERAMAQSQAGAIVASFDLKRVEGKQYLLARDPSRAFQKIIERFCPGIPSGFTGIHPTAVIHETAQLSEGVILGPYVVIDREATIGEGTVIVAHGFIGAHTTVGKECYLHPHVTVREGCRIGSRVVLQPGVVIGACGFGYTTNDQGYHQQLTQRGNVVIEDDVEIGANTTIDRARFGSTSIGQGSKIDNQVQIAHGVTIGRDNLIAGQTGIAGSAKTGRHVVVAGQVGIAGHLALGDGVIIAARSGVIGSIKKSGKYIGEPARPYEEYKRFWMRLLGLEKLYKRQKKVEERLEELEKNQTQGE